MKTSKARLQQELIEAFHARGAAAAAHLERGGKCYEVDQVLSEMGAMGARRRRELVEGCSRVERWVTAPEAADLVGVSRPFMDCIFYSGVIQIVIGADNQRRALKSHVLAWHEGFRYRQRELIKELSRRGDDEENSRDED